MPGTPQCTVGGVGPEDAGLLVGVDVGGTQVRAARVVAGQVQGLVSHPTPAQAGAAAVIDAIVRAVGEVGPGSRTRVGISSAGVIDPATGTVVAATDLIRGWAGTRLAEEVSDRLQLPVRVVNDVHGHALGEWHHGAGRGASSMLLVAAGTGLGGALVSDGRLLIGAHHVAGHLGHVPCEQAAGLRCSCGATGHLESVASGSGLELLHRHLHPHSTPASSRAIAQAAADGDPDARRTVRTSGAALGAAIGGWCNLLDPSLVVVTGGLANAGELWWESLREAQQQHVLPPASDTAIVLAQHPDDAALLGAASLFTHPSVPMTGDPS
ncbi:MULTISPECIES: ROK family protein [unclassified Luteococcus]|uniref:ROK family protein n=1 Tax=unclassified Luteococcus TaxID=2639923 RepID=UPI00313B9E8D